MFYSDSLLAKTGPLARVWLAANVERNLKKSQILTSNLEENVKDIIGPGQAPMALRLSGQLLLGVVKIYSKKAQFLMDDCHDALRRIQMAFRPGNNDLPSNQMSTANATSLVLPDAVTEIDLFAPIQPVEELLRNGPKGFGGLHDSTLLADSSQLLPATQTPRKKERPIINPYDDVDLGLDLGEDDGLRSTPVTEDHSVEIGRRAPTPRRDEPSLFDGMDLGLDLGDENDTTLPADISVQRLPPNDDDVLMLDEDEEYRAAPFGDIIAAQNEAAFARAEAAAERRQRDSASPLSEISPEAERVLEKSFRLGVNEDEDTTIMQAAQRLKRRKVMRQDHETQLHNSQIKRQQEDRSAITKQPTFLSRDPLLLQLMEMQRNGSFVSSIMGDGRMASWAPELRGILSLEVVTKSSEKKRKRDSGVADVGSGDEEVASPRIEIPEDNSGFLAGRGAEFDDGTMPIDNDAGVYPGTPGAPFDTTEAPLLHPSESGPISIGTKNAVHLLRDFFAPGHSATGLSAPPTPAKRVKAEVLFTDLCPERRTSRPDATKMFFELLVLGTKDAIKVEQGSDSLGLPIRVRGKRGLWGDWAEKGAGGEIAAQEQAEEVNAEA